MATAGFQLAHDAEHRTTFKNPVIWEDLPDMEVIRLGDIYYMSASSFAFSPGAPILQSYNLVDWEYIGHSVPELAFGERFYLNGQHSGAYVKGIWASTLKYQRTYIYTAKDPRDVWTALSPIDKFYYDLGLLIDEDDTFYLAYGTKTICVARLSADGTKEIESRPVYTSDEYLEGARMYNIKDTYYIWLTRPYSGQYVLKSTVGPFGPYECQPVVGPILSPIPGSGCPHQGALVDTPEGRWYYMAFMDGFPGGRIPVLAPVTFTNDGWLEVEYDVSKPLGEWRLEYPYFTHSKKVVHIKTCFRKHTFDKKLEHCWEWNHNPDNSKWQTQDGHLLLKAGTVTDNLYMATNTLTHRTIGPRSMATFFIDASGMSDGDRAGACMFKDKSAYIGIHKEGNSSRLVYVDDLRHSPISIPVGWSNGHPVALDWKIDTNGTVAAEAPLENKRVWLRAKVDVTPAHSHGHEKETRYAIFEYSYDGSTFKQLGPPFGLTNDALGYMGYRFGLFNFATIALGGSVVIKDCDIASWDVEN
ncbi:Arabinanase/levansucrase/invertase [Thozetella sp. PMI_491]|nr:Arabinanase/levansucrase/invertase [Thozetella sp. PMI_491]